MLFFKILILLFVGFILSVNLSYAQNIKYSVGPVCNGEKVYCKGSNEVPICIVLNPKIHIESIELEGGNKINRFQPLCNGDEDNLQLRCIDLLAKSVVESENVVVECFEQVKCVKDSYKLIAFCEGGKIPKCLGSDNEPNCNSETLCSGKSIPVCDYVWQVDAGSSLKIGG